MDPEFDRALTAIEASDDWNAAHAGAGSLSARVLPAIETLRGYLEDDRVIARGDSALSVIGTMGEHAFGAIRDAIETHLPNRYTAYSAFSRNDVGDWLDHHQNKTLVELQIEAATTSLERAKREYELDGNADAQAAIAVYAELLEARLLTQSICDIRDSDVAYSGLSVMFNRTKLINVKIYGTIGSRSDMDLLHHHVNAQPENHVSLHWDVRLQDTGETIVGLDHDVYSKPQRTTEP